MALTPPRLFSKFSRSALPLADLLAVQFDSWRWFWEKGIQELFEELSPITDYSAKEFELTFGDFRLDPPRFNEFESRAHNASYESTLRIKTRLLNKRTKEVKEQEVYLGEFPLIAPRGTFMVNGVERVIIPQLIRSPGVFFTREKLRGSNLFGAKIIPNRGAWLEFETDASGMIGVKIDRRRKAPITTLLRAFGINESEMQKTLGLVDNGEISYMKETLKRDTTKTSDEALIEIYKRVRTGDLATVENARSLINSMFFNFTRYALGRVGRWKMEMRLEEKSMDPNLLGREERVLKPKDVLRIIKEIIQLNNETNAQPDEIDHLGNRRVRAFGELLQQRLRTGFTRMERIVKDRMSTLDPATITPMQLVNARPIAASVREFFSSSQLSQFMDNVNPLAELEHKRRVSAMGPGGLTRERAGFEVRDVQPSHYGRICPIQTPEGPNIGLVGHLASYARLNPFGFIETPYFKVKNGKISDEIVWLDASIEQRHVIAHGGTLQDNRGRILEDKVEVRVHGEASLVDKNVVDLIDVAPPQAPLVGTGTERIAARESGQVVLSEEDGIVTYVDASRITISGKRGTKEYPLRTFLRSNQASTITQKPLVHRGEKVKRGDILADGAAMDQGELALGQNLLVAFLPWRGWNYEDAIVISERVVLEDRFTSIHIEDFVCDVRDTKLGHEVTTPDIPNVGEDKLRNLDEEGIVRVGAEVGPGDILAGKITPKGETDLTAEERLLRAIFGEKARDVKDTSLRLPHGKRGRVIS